MNERFSGGCACGSVRFELASAPSGAGWCHCRICRLCSGAPATVFASVPAGDFRFVAGEDMVGRFRSSALGQRLFCRSCGSPIAMQADDPARTIDFSVALLNRPELVAPGFHMFEASRIAWFACADDLPRHQRERPQTG